MIIPVWQYPHCGTSLSIQACWTLCSAPSGGQTFDRGDLFAAGFADQYATGAHRNAVDMDRAGPALCYAATVFGAGQADIFPDRPKQRRIRLDIHVESFAIDDEVHR